MVQYKRKRIVRKKVLRRKTYVPRIPKYERPLVVKRSYSQSLSGAGATQLYGVGWTLNGLPNYTDITNMFAEYRITFVKLKVTLRNELAGASTDTIPRMFIVRNYTDISNPASLDELREYAGVKIKKLSYNRATMFTLRPATTLLQGDGTTKIPQWKQWIPTGSPGCVYNGVKMGFDPIPTGQTVDLEWSIWVHAKKQK